MTTTGPPSGVKPHRGDVWWVRFDPSVGGEARKTRPAVIVSSDVSNRSLNRCLAVPLTSNTGRLYRTEAVVTVRERASKAMADQLTTVSLLRLGARIGRVSPSDLQAVERAVLIHLGLQTLNR